MQYESLRKKKKIKIQKNMIIGKKKYGRNVEILMPSYVKACK